MATPEGSHGSARAIASRTLVQASVVAAVVLLCWITWLAFDFVLLLFASILVATLIHGVSCWISEKTGLSRDLGMLVFFVVLLGVLGAGGWLIAPNVAEQFGALSDSLPEAVQRLRQRAEESAWMSRLLDQQDRLETAITENGAFGAVTKVMSSTVGALASFLIAFAIGVALSLRPRIYVDGFLALIPAGYRPRAREVLEESGSTLQSWLVAKLFEMLLIGVLTTLGLWLLGIELALVLGVIAGLLSFIPNIGPVLALIPAVLLASMEGTRTMLYVVGLYTVVQALESYLFTPWMQQRIVAVPPALTISVQVLFSLLAGTLGLLLATPLAAVGMVLVRRLYIEDLLGERDRSA